MKLVLSSIYFHIYQVASQCSSATDPPKAEGFTTPLRQMGVTVAVYGSEIVTFRPVDCTGICHSSVMVTTRAGAQVQTCCKGRQKVSEVVHREVAGLCTEQMSRQIRQECRSCNDNDLARANNASD